MPIVEKRIDAGRLVQYHQSGGGGEYLREKSMSGYRRRAG